MPAAPGNVGSKVFCHLRFRNKANEPKLNRAIVAGSGIVIAPLKPLPRKYPPESIYVKL